MPRLDILLPFAIPPTDLAADLRKQIDAPALAALTTRSRSRRTDTFDEYGYALPHERWLAARFGLAGNGASSPPLAATLMREYGHDVDDGLWFILHPVHLHIARDHLVLTDPHRLDLDEQEARALFDAARPLFEEYGHALVYGDAGTWFMRADAWDGLATATPDAAAGHNIDLWIARGEGERAWRKLQNEVQMHWFMHPLNAAREASGKLPVNSLWLWGAAPAGLAGNYEYKSVFAVPGSRVPLPLRARVAANPGDLTFEDDAHALLILDELLTPALSADWGAWLEALRALEREWFAPLLEQLRKGRIETLELIGTGDQRLQHFCATRGSLRKFWRSPSLDTLLS